MNFLKSKKGGIFARKYMETGKQFQDIFIAKDTLPFSEVLKIANNVLGVLSTRSKKRLQKRYESERKY